MTPEQVEHVFREKGLQVFRRCRLLLGTSAEADDVLQEVFVRLIRYGKFKPHEEVPMAWLYRTAERACFTRMKKRRREPLLDDPELIEALTDTHDWERPLGARQALANLFGRLKPEQQRLALMYYYDEMTREEIAEALGTSRRSVGRRLDKLRALAEKWTERAGGAQ